MVPDYIIATDGSSKANPTGRHFVGYAYVLMNYHTHQYITYKGPLGDDKSVAFAEAWALYQAIRQLNVVVDNTYPEDKEKYDKRGVNLLAITDSKLLVDTFNTWIPQSWNLKDYYHWKKADGSDVRNQEVFRYILKAMQVHQITMRITHINSHVHTKELRNHIKAKMKRNNIRMDPWTVDLLINMNQMADDMAQEVTGEVKKSKDYLPGLIMTEERKKQGWLAT